MLSNSAPPKPPLEFFPQERDYTCAVACLRMVAHALGVSKTEDELLPICRTTEDGTHRDDLVAAAQSLGFSIQQGRLSADDLCAATYPIVYLDRTPLDGVMAIHSVVVVEAGATVKVLDPK